MGAAAPVPPPFPAHVAIIMDGNGRWATRRGLARCAGHVAGARAVRRAVEAARILGIRTLTLYAFSVENWRRPPQEVSALMGLFTEYLLAERERCRAQDIRVTVFGRRDRLAPALRRAIEDVERSTMLGASMDVRFAIDYSARDAIVRAAALAGASRPPGRPTTRERFAHLLARATHAPVAPPDVDLLIRTGGERRLSDFLLWECAWAELVFLDRAWPEFCASDLEDALAEFQRRERRFGALAPADARSA